MPQGDEQERWRAVLTEPGVAPQARLFRWLPSNPRCPICRAPFGLPFGPVLHLLGFGRSKRYPQLCNPCFSYALHGRGGAEIPITVLFADVRGSTGMAERSSPAEFSTLLSRFYAQATEAVRAEGGIIDKFLGDGVMALFIPSFTDGQHAMRGLRAALRILRGAAADRHRSQHRSGLHRLPGAVRRGVGVQRPRRRSEHRASAR
jgi:adenylate cyclase